MALINPLSNFSLGGKSIPGMDGLPDGAAVKIPTAADLEGIAGTQEIGGTQSLAGATGIGGNRGAEPFGAMLDRFVSDVDGKMKAASAEKAKVMNGESTNLHQAMISMQESSVAFTLMVEVRNKLVEGYQELMRMQV